jgi:hypothetical protein
MKRLLFCLLLSGLALGGIAGAAAQSPTAAIDAGLDPVALLAEATQTWNLANEDAVLLLEQARFTWLDDGRLREERHRVVWIGSAVGLRNFADLRVPWDADRQTLVVRTLRVRRDGRWIDARPTATVETTPFALRAAPDYAGLRETMLLHDGVELPCILECDYALEDKRPWRAGMEGEWTFGHVAPALDSRLILDTPQGTPLLLDASTEVAYPTTTAPPGRTVIAWRMRRLPAAPLPAPGRPAADLPRVQWSTFPDWRHLGGSVLTAFGRGLELDPALADSLAVLLDGAGLAPERARRVCDFVQHSTRRIAWDARLLLPRARPAARVFATAYGSDLDLAVLTAALLRGAGFAAGPAFLGTAPGEAAGNAPTFAPFLPPGVWLEGDGYAAWWDAASGALQTGATLTNRAFWRPDFDQDPLPPQAAKDATANRVTTTLDLRWDAAQKRWTGGGSYEATGALCSYDALTTGAGAARAQLDRIVGGVLPGAAVEDFSFPAAGPASVASTFVVKPFAAARDSLGRWSVVIGAPTGGVAAALPHDAPLWLGAREAPVRLPGPLAQTVRVSLAIGGLETIRLPEPTRLENAAGSFILTVERRGGRVIVERTLRLDKAFYPAQEWPDLRSLLLADAHDASRTLLLKRIIGQTPPVTP